MQKGTASLNIPRRTAKSLQASDSKRAKLDESKKDLSNKPKSVDIKGVHDSENHKAKEDVNKLTPEKPESKAKVDKEESEQEPEINNGERPLSSEDAKTESVSEEDSDMRREQSSIRTVKGGEKNE